MYQAIIDFWFNEISPSQWWQKDDEFDALIQRRFADLHAQALAGELYLWRENALGSLAEIIVLDQFSRNIYRGLAASFTADPLALALAQVAIGKGFDQALNPAQRGFMYLPFMHSESAFIQQQAIALYEGLGNENQLEFAHKHKAIIDQFGRYPHRNAILGRQSTAQELAFLEQPNSSF